MNLYSDTPMMRFWDGLNAHMRKCGLPELRWGEIRPIWEHAISEAGQAIRDRPFEEAA